MAGKIPGHIIARIRESVDIIDIISLFCTIEMRGRTHKALCPFNDHNEKTPSFTADREKQLYHCFGCHRGGDVINFVMEIKGISFVEALRFLGDGCGIDIEQFLGREHSSEHDKMLDMNNRAASFYSSQLFKNQQALDYIMKKRGIDRAHCEMFRLGYAEEQWRNLIEHIGKNQFNLSLLTECGLVSEKNGTHYDFFRHRLVFPVMDIKGNIIGFSARAMADNQQPKYLNTKENELYHKREILYGLNLAWAEIKKTGYAVITEGNVDVIKAHQAGMKNVVATCGTSLTQNHIRLLKRYTDRIYMAFDTDTAGIKSAAASIEMFMKEGCTIGVITLPFGKDLDDFFSRAGREDFEKLVENAPDIIDFKIDSIISLCNNAHAYKDKIDAIQRFEPFYATISDSLISAEAIKRFAERLKCTVDYILKNMRNPEQKTEQKVHISSKATDYNVLERVFLGLLLKKPQLYAIILENEAEIHLKHTMYQKIYNKFKNCGGTKDLQTFLDMIKDENEKRLIRELAFSEDIPLDNADTIFEDAARNIEMRTLESFRQELLSSMNQLAAEKKRERMKLYMELSQSLKKGDIKGVKKIYNKLKAGEVHEEKDDG